jgi:DNA polymerase-3 subunit alpha
LEEEIRFGLLTVKNLGHDIADAIVNERNSGGKYKSLEDFLERVKHKNLNKKSLEALTMCGALDDFAERGVILANSEAILDYHKTFVKDSTLQDSLFAELSDDSHKKITLKPAKAVDITTKLKWERELLGLYVSGFPLDPWKEKILARQINIQAVLEDIKDGTEVNIPALIETVKVTKTKKGDRMALVNLRDYTGSFEVAVFPESYLKFKDYCKADTIVVVRGKVSSRNGTKTLVVDDMKELK